MLKRITYVGRGTHYLVFLKETGVHFVVGRNDKIDIPGEVYAALEQHGDIAKGKLADVTPAQVTKKALGKLRFGEIS